MYNNILFLLLCKKIKLLVANASYIDEVSFFINRLNVATPEH